MNHNISSLCIFYDEGSREHVKGFAAHHGLPIYQVDIATNTWHTVLLQGQGGTEDMTVLLLSNIDEDRLNTALKPEIRACVEATSRCVGLDDKIFSRIEDNHAFLSLTTASAYDTQVALHFTRWISHKIKIDDNLLSNLELCLQEAMANGLIHGNMGIDKTLPDNFHDLGAYGEKVRNKLSDDTYGQLRVEISARWDDDFIDISVVDHGAGFNTTDPIQKSVTGLGLSLIRGMVKSLDITENGRKIIMRFAR